MSTNIIPFWSCQVGNSSTAGRGAAQKNGRKPEGSGPAPRKVVRLADPPLDDEDAKERQVAALMSAWNKASAEARQEFLERIDVPVMDRSAA